MAALGSPNSPSKEKEGLVTITLDEAAAAAAASAGGSQGRGGMGGGDTTADSSGSSGGPQGRRAGGGRRWMPCLSPYTLAVLAAIMGNVLEFYDFSIYGLVRVVLWVVVCVVMCVHI